MPFNSHIKTYYRLNIKKCALYTSITPNNVYNIYIQYSNNIIIFMLIDLKYTYYEINVFYLYIYIYILLFLLG